MSDSKTQNGSTNQGGCVVCGKESSLRCSECAKHGIGWMYFCSVEHQRFIWTAHKCTCSVNCNPFQWPLLTKKEQEQWRLLKNCQFKGTTMTWEQLFESRDVSFEQMLALYDFDNFHKIHDNDPDFEGERSPGLPSARSTAFHLRLEQKRKDLGTSLPANELQLYRIMAQDPYGYLGFSLTENGVNLEELATHKFGTDVYHRLTILFAIICRHYEAPELYYDQHRKLIQHATKEVEGILGRHVSKDLPSEAYKIIFKLGTGFVEKLKDLETGKEVSIWAFKK